ncbi:MAG TPA: hypothetical protein VD772_13055, partial [Anseongella sp.]|nr:hypothetical protein [Anseongella sp.]
DPVSGPHSRGTELRHTGNRLSPGNRFYTHDGARLAVALTNIYYGLHQGCTLFKDGKHQEAIAIVEAAKASAEIDNAVLKDDALEAEIRLLGKLATNMR